MIHYKFAKDLDRHFSDTLKIRVANYFTDNGIDRNANSDMVIKSIVAIGFYLFTYLVMVFSGISSVPILFGLWALLGVGQAFIGTAVMHDVLHGSYSKDKRINRIMTFAPIIIGVEPLTWKIQHNVLHHTYTNIEEADEDIAPRYVLRFTPNQPKRWFHRFQHIYVVFFYSIPIIIWATAKDFIKIFKYRKLGLIQPGRALANAFIGVVFRKSIFYFIFLAVPMWALPVSAGMVIGMFITMLVVTGLVLSLVFQTAHLVPDLSFVEQEEEYIRQNWSTHQLLTTTNYATGNKFLTWFFGSLNFQVEHHLFPNICHVHYPQLAKIVKATALEFGLPYHEQKTFGSAIAQHFKMLYALGR